MKLWIDDIRPAPEGYIHLRSVDEAKKCIECAEYCDSLVMSVPLEIRPPEMKRSKYHIEIIDIDHDAGEYAQYGGDYIKLLDWLEETGRNYPIRIHSMNPVGVENMRRIINKNNWKEIM